MSYLNNQTVSIDAILTNRGRALLAKGSSFFNITQFCLSDDSIDYSLWNPSHPLGSNYYGIVIESMPILEASPDETQMMKYKLITLPKKTTRIPVITVGQTNIVLTAGGDSAIIAPNTSNFQNGNASLGYTAILLNSDVATLQVAPGGELKNGVTPTIPAFIGDNESSQSQAVSGFKFQVIAKDSPLADSTTSVLILGNETGGRQIVNITVRQMQVFTAPNLPLTNVTNTSNNANL